MAYPELGYELLARLVEELEGLADMVKPPEMEGRLMVMHLMPKK